MRGEFSLEFGVVMVVRGERNARPHDSLPLVGAGLGAGSMPVVRLGIFLHLSCI